MDYNQHHLIITVPNELPDIDIDSLINDIKSTGVNVGVEKFEFSQPFNALEWAIPTLVVTYLIKPYFDGFLKEMGKDNYLILKDWLKKIANKLRTIKVVTITADGSEGKENKNNTQSKSFSLILQTKNGKNIKLLFDNDLTKEDWDNAIDMLLDYAIEHYENIPNDKLTVELNKIEEKNRNSIFAIIDKQTKELVFYNLKDVLLKDIQEREDK